MIIKDSALPQWLELTAVQYKVQIYFNVKSEFRLKQILLIQYNV